MSWIVDAYLSTSSLRADSGRTDVTTVESLASWEHTTGDHLYVDVYFPEFKAGIFIHDVHCKYALLMIYVCKYGFASSPTNKTGIVHIPTTRLIWSLWGYDQPP